MPRAPLLLVLAAGLLLSGVAPALAHKLKVFATAIDGTAAGRVYFVGGGPALDVEVRLTDAAGTVLARSRTTAPDGRFAIALPGAGPFTLTADGRDGHVAAFALTLQTGPGEAIAGPSPPAGDPRPAASAELDAIEIAVARQVAPLAEQVDAMRETLRFRDLIGGVGYVFGLFGLWALLLRRKSAGQ